MLKLCQRTIYLGHAISLITVNVFTFDSILKGYIPLKILSMI